MGFFNFFKRDITEEEFQEQQKVKRGLEKTRTGFFQSIVNTLTNAQIDDDCLLYTSPSPRDCS